MTDRFATVRERMVQEQLLRRGITDSRTLQAMAEVPRHLFVDDAMQASSYGDHPLPIAGDQTISQPYIVAAMTQALQLLGDEKVLEIGTGSGYQAAVLSRLCTKVYTVERINTLLAGARRIFDQLHYYNILSRLDDGTLGWAEYAPYDAIIVTAGGPGIPDSLVEQLADPGRLVIPVGGRDVQELQLLTKEDGEIHIQRLESVRFVSLIGEQGWNG
ncbi:MAG: protein-L-isoaspartate(D-aspartate) O-methyltransferase [Proteobacteria bacterium]|nr:protein-L-isoaspartate(D-aspartate) O-methyltransferase [Pseudomonadota bacterium]MBU1138448.1 protein-L-isoaspartate(D-aspartate) O-methyltransferase [Pseudomonadota bacterium]MBU1232697.1 protein-L-isoaspartate(D-aspartate) O-methyltransferase [Pseudomonadota bacterium]MBU1418848.1 protein-L-isoaspartate(D-aspartate) O-methyltransferase [Pseudomonadota bacterium]MBU1455728.1 protein-L-isoaspartate(D-aspartate) O-methyltransferase [Pseudomonadota bacterium]